MNFQHTKFQINSISIMSDKSAFVSLHVKVFVASILQLRSEKTSLKSSSNFPLNSTGEKATPTISTVVYWIVLFRQNGTLVMESIERILSSSGGICPSKNT